MSREWLTGGALVVGVCLSTTSVFAQPAQAAADDEIDCPPGAYCQVEDVGPAEQGSAPASPSNGGSASGAESPEVETVVVVRQPDGSTTIELPPPDAGADPRAPRTFTYVPPRNGRPGQVIVYDDGSAPPRLPPGASVGKLPDRGSKTGKSRARPERHRRWGLMARGSSALMPRYRDDVGEYGMVGVGLSLRYRPVPAFAFDFGADVLGGVDSSGLERRELPFNISAVLYPNPHDFAQIYFYGGLGGALASVATDGETRRNLADGTSDDYRYVGAHLGAGVEMRLTPLLGLSLDAQAYARTRSDDGDHNLYPEFYDPISGESSNTSVGGLARAGINFWW